MIEILLIKGSDNIKSIATIERISTYNQDCDAVVYTIAKAIHNYGTIIDKINDSEYPIAYHISVNDKTSKIVARDINE